MAEDNRFTILIEMLSKLEGGQQAVAIVKQLQVESENLGHSTEKLTDDFKEHGKETEHVHGEHHAMHMLMRQIGHETAPEMEHAMHAMFLGPLGAGVAFLAVLSMIREGISKFGEALDKSSEAASDKRFLDGIKARIEAIENLVDEQNKYIESLRNAVTEEDTFRQAEERTQKVIEARMTAEERAAKAAKDAAMARVEEQAKTGQLNPLQAAQERYVIESQFAAAEAQRAKNKDAAQLKELQQEQAGHDTSKARLATDEERAAKANEAAQAALIGQQKRYAELEKERATNEENAKLFQKMTDSASTFAEQMSAMVALQGKGVLPPALPGQDAKEQGRIAAEAMKAQEEIAAGTIKKMFETGGATGVGGKIEEAKHAADMAAQQLELAKKNQTQNQESLNKITQQVEDLKAIMAAKAPGTAAATASEAEAARAKRDAEIIAMYSGTGTPQAPHGFQGTMSASDIWQIMHPGVPFRGPQSPVQPTELPPGASGDNASDLARQIVLMKQRIAQLEGLLDQAIDDKKGSETLQKIVATLEQRSRELQDLQNRVQATHAHDNPGG